MTEPGATPARPKSGNKRAGESFASAAMIHLKRAANVDIAAGERLPDERTLLSTGLDQGSDAYGRLLLWRRSFLYVGLLALAPTLLFEAITTIVALADTNAGGAAINQGSQGVLGGLRFLLLCLNITMAIGVFLALKRWSDWERSRRILFWTWLIAFLAPFVVALFPMRALGDGRTNALGLTLLGLLGGLQAVMQLAPKAISLIPGLLRAAIATKVLFPGSTAPGWLVILAAPFFLLLLFVVLLIPYQLSGSPLIIIAILAFMLAPIWLWRSGAALARPAIRDDALTLVKRTRLMSIALNGIGALFLLIGLLTSELTLDAFDVIKLLLSIAANVLVLSVVAMDLMTRTLTRAHLERLALSSHEANLTHGEQVVTFAAAAGISLDAPASDHAEAVPDGE